MKLIVKQGIKHIITGGFADLADIGVFNLLFWFFPAQLAVKAVSFLAAAAIKYLGNKYWAFSAQGGPASGGEKVDTAKELTIFFLITLIGLAINVASFYFSVRINPGLSSELWREVSVIFALMVTAIWNFCGYKFIVFKK